MLKLYLQQCFVLLRTIHAKLKAEKIKSFLSKIYQHLTILNACADVKEFYSNKHTTSFNKLNIGFLQMKNFRGMLYFSSLQSYN